MRNLVNAAVLCACSSAAVAGPWGNDFGLSYNAVAAGMGASTYANPYTAADSVFGNPATMVNLDQTPRTVSFGAAYANIDFTLDHDGSVTGAPFSGKSDTVNFLIPNVAVIGQLGDDWAIGGGLNITAGLAADFRTDTPLSPGITYLAFGNNLTLARRLGEHWSIGVSAIMGFGLIEVGPVQSSGAVNDIGFRGKIGVAYHNDNFSFSAHYKSQLSFNFENAFLITGTEFGDLPLEQPNEFVLSTSYRFAEHWDWQAALLHLKWGDADGYGDIWEDQTVFTTGIQYSKGPWAYRAGFGFTNDLRREELGSSFGGNTTLGFGGQTIPLSPPVVEFLQAALAPSFWEYSLSAGLGYKFDNVTQLDLFVSSVFGPDEEISAMNTTDVDILNLGAGFTWRF